MHYLDNAAAAPMRAEALEALCAACECDFGNVSSQHAVGLRAEKLLVDARDKISVCFSPRGQAVFTSGGTEANNLAIFGAAHALRRRGKRVVSSAAEHASVIEPLKRLRSDGFEIVLLHPRADGQINEAELCAAVTADTVLVSLSCVNNETGALQGLNIARRAIADAGSPALLHTDAVQAFGKFAPSAFGGADLVSASAHKLGGPKGVGALWIKDGVRIEPQLLGGGQQRGLRAGTEPVPLVASFAVAAGCAARAVPDEARRVEAVNARLRRGLETLGGVIVNSPDGASPYILNFSAPGYPSAVLTRFLEQRDIYVSAGSACHRGARSHVLTAMGLSADRVESAVRVSFSSANIEEDVDALLSALEDAFRTLRGSGPAKR